MASSGSGGNDPNDNNNNDSNKNRYHYRNFNSRRGRFLDEFQNLRLTSEEIQYLIITFKIIRARLDELKDDGSHRLDSDFEALVSLGSTAYEDLKFLLERGLFYDKQERNIPYKNQNDERYFAGVYFDFHQLIYHLFNPRLRGDQPRGHLTLYKDGSNIFLYRKREILKSGALRKLAAPITMVFLGNAKETVEVITRVIIGLNDYDSQLSSNVMPYSGEPMDLDEDPKDIYDSTPTG